MEIHEGVFNKIRNLHGSTGRCCHYDPYHIRKYKRLFPMQSVTYMEVQDGVSATMRN